ncbi:MAG: glycosyltransferase family 4 protein [Anaerolineae bacterium]
MRVCWLASSYPRWAGDGAGSFIASLAQALAERGHQIEVVAPWDSALQLMDTGPVRVHRFRYAPGDALHLMGHGRSLEADVRLKAVVPLLAPVYIMSALAAARRLHRQQPFDLLHGHWSVPGGYAAALLARQLKLPYLVSLHGSDVYLTERNKLWATAARRAFRRARFVTAPAQHLLERSLPAGLDLARSRVIPYGVDTRRFARGDGQTLRGRLGIPADALVVGALGRLVYKKGFDNLLTALPAVCFQFPQLRCLIAGEGDLQGALKAQIVRLGLQDTVSLLGHVSWQDTPDYYALCDVLAIPSVQDRAGNVDGLPNVLLEAMASGCAVVASRVAGMETVITDGTHGLLVPPGDSSALSRALIAFLADKSLRQRCGAAARQVMREQYEWQHIAEEFNSLYQAACQ